jgi:hypothetical protein
MTPARRRKRPLSTERVSMKRTLLTAAAVTLLSGSAAAEPQTTTETMSFEACVRSIQTTAAQLGMAPINIVETNILRMVRFCAADGQSVLVTCSQPDGKRAITVSPHSC